MTGDFLLHAVMTGGLFTSRPDGRPLGPDVDRRRPALARRPPGPSGCIPRPRQPATHVCPAAHSNLDPTPTTVGPRSLADPQDPRIHSPALVVLTSLPQHRRPSQPVPGPASSQSPDVVPGQSVRRRGRLGAQWDSRLGIRTDKVVSRPSPHSPLGEPYSDGDRTSPPFPTALGTSTHRILVRTLHRYCMLTADPCRPTRQSTRGVCRIFPRRRFPRRLYTSVGGLSRSLEY